MNEQQKHMPIQDQVPRVEGVVELFVNRPGPDHELVRYEVFKNLVLNALRENEYYALAGDAVATRQINSIGMGTDNTAPTVGDTGLSADAEYATASLYGYGTRSVTFQAVFGSADANGKVYYEVGLRTAGNILVARRVFSGLDKTADFEYTWRWTLQWVTS